MLLKPKLDKLNLLINLLIINTLIRSKYLSAISFVSILCKYGNERNCRQVLQGNGGGGL